MLDIRFIRENAELVAEKSRQKGYEADVEQLLGFDKKYLELLKMVEQKRKDRNDFASALAKEGPGSASAGNIEQGRKIKQELADFEHQLEVLGQERDTLLRKVPNMPADDVPVGSSEAENVISKEWGEKPQFDFQPKTHWQIAETRDLIDKERAVKIAGSRFAYIKGDLVRLQFAIVQFTLDTLTSQEKLKKIIADAGLGVTPKPFVPVLPPAMIRTDVFDKMDRLEPRDDRYKVGEDQDNLWLQGSAEHTLGPMYMDEILSAEQLPIRYVGYLTSFRREAGSYGKDTEGIIRMHQFDKLEMESFSVGETGMDEHLFFVAIQEHLMQALKIPYRVLNKCTADIGKPNARGIDIEAWLPGANTYKETHTADYMTDYQTRRLNSRVKIGGEISFMHTNDATAFALGRTLVAIIENYQNSDGSIRIPEALKSYMGGAAAI